MAVFMQTQKKSGVAGWIDTFYNVTMNLASHINSANDQDHPITILHDQVGHKGVQSEAILITNAFEKQYAFQNWDDLDYWITLDNFVENWFE